MSWRRRAGRRDGLHSSSNSEVLHQHFVGCTETPPCTARFFSSPTPLTKDRLRNVNVTRQGVCDSTCVTEHIREKNW